MKKRYVIGIIAIFVVGAMFVISKIKDKLLEKAIVKELVKGDIYNENFN